VVVEELETNSLVIERANQIEKLSRGNTHSSGRRNLGDDLSMKSEIKIGRGQVQPAVFRFQQNVCEDRNRVLALNHTLQNLKFIQELPALDCQFHITPDEGERISHRILVVGLCESVFS
jgi:hypothetical protein